jgi:hypothetical protein
MEMGKPMKQALGEISATQSRVKFAVDNAFKALEPITVSETATFEERVEYEPLGVVANISAWNYPYFVARSVLASSSVELVVLLFCPTTRVCLRETCRVSSPEMSLALTYEARTYVVWSADEVVCT